MLVAQDIEVLFLDNLSCLYSPEDDDENNTAGFAEMQRWLVKLRRKGKSVVFLHHTGKADMFGNTKQRGTSKKEDVLNSSILLETPGKGEIFKVKFTKHRGFIEPPVLPVKCEGEEGGPLRLTIFDVDEQILMYHCEGMKQVEIAALVGVDQGTISRRLASLKAKRCNRKE